MFKKLMMTLAVAGAASPAFGGLVLRLNTDLAPYTGSGSGSVAASPNSTIDSTQSIFKGRTDLGWMFMAGQMGLSFGVNHLYYFNTTKTTDNSTGLVLTSKERFSPALGAWAGVNWMGLSMDFTYYFLAPNLVSGNTTYKHSGFNWEANLGYTPSITPWFAIGPRLGYRSLTFGEAEKATGTTTYDGRKASSSELSVYLAMDFHFGGKGK